MCRARAQGGRALIQTTYRVTRLDARVFPWENPGLIRVKAVIRGVLACLLVLTVAVWVFVLFAERSFIYFPMKAFEDPAWFQAAGFEDLHLTAEDETRLHGLFLPGPAAKVTVLISHGNAGNISHRTERALLFREWLDANVLLYDYRGFGRSEGAPDEPGTYQDARAAYKHLVESRGIPPAQIVLFGESLGCAVTLELASNHPSAAVVLEAPFTSVPDMSRLVFPMLPVGAFIKNRYDNLSKIGRLRTPVLVMHGDRDEVVPYWMGERLFASAREPKRFFKIVGAGHNDTYTAGGDAYRNALVQFVRDNVVSKP